MSIEGGCWRRGSGFLFEKPLLPVLTRTVGIQKARQP
eukprot:12236.XXX_35137_35247_1 [CDS] Oithona nana genome sequencing.